MTKIRIPNQLTAKAYGKDRQGDVYISIVGDSLVLIGNQGDYEEYTLPHALPTITGFIGKHIATSLAEALYTDGAQIEVTTAPRAKYTYDTRNCAIDRTIITDDVIRVTYTTGGLRSRITATIATDGYTELRLIAEACQLSTASLALAA